MIRVFLIIALVAVWTHAAWIWAWKWTSGGRELDVKVSGESILLCVEIDCIFLSAQDARDLSKVLNTAADRAAEESGRKLK